MIGRRAFMTLLGGAAAAWSFVALAQQGQGKRRIGLLIQPCRESVLMRLARIPGGGLIISPDAFTVTHRKLIIDLAARYVLPAVYSERIFAAEGGLVSYGGDYVEYFGRRRLTSTEYCAARSQGIFPCSSRASFNWSSI